MNIELLGSLGDDLSIVNAARIGVHERSEELGERERSLINSLLRTATGRRSRWCSSSSACGHPSA
jgi:hypothetical protein